MNSISQNIKAYRKTNNLTQRQMADRLGVTHQTVSNWESGRSMPSIDKLNDICEKLNIDINFLLYGKKADNTELERQIKKYFVWFVFCLLFGIFTIVYQEYRLANDVNLHIQSTIDLRYILPGRIYVLFIRPWVYIFPVFIIFSILKHKGFIRDKAENKIYPLMKIILILLLVYCAIAYWWIWGLSPVYNINSFVSYIPVNIRVSMGNSTVFFMGNPAVFSRMALICEVFRPFTNDKTIIPAHSPGRNNSIARNIRKLRTEKGFTQQQLADKLFITRQTVSNWENGKIMPDINMLINISECTETDLNSLIYSETVTGKRTVFDFICTVSVIAAILALVIARRIIRHNLPSYSPTWWQQAFMRLYMSVRSVLIRPVLYFTIPVLVIQICKLRGRFTHFKGFKYRKIMAFLIVLFMVLTFYNYLPYMVKTDLKKCFQLSEPILWLNYPSFDWLISLPQLLSSTLYYICDNMRWLYSLQGIIFEISKPYGEAEKK